jgi:hypothetical protein
MRSILVRWLSLILCCPLAAGCACAVEGDIAPPSKKAPASKEAGNGKKAGLSTWSVEGWGLTQEDAEKHALKKARDKIIAYLQGQDPPLVWTPSADYVRKSFMTGKPQRCEEQEKIEVDRKPMECWSWTVTVQPLQLEMMRREDAKYRAQQALAARLPAAEARMAELGKLVGWAVLALAGLWVYVRVDDWTAGTRRRWLRFALASVVGCGGLGWWLLS